MDTVETCVVVCEIGRGSSHERTLSVVIRNKGLEPPYRYLGELETDRAGGGAEVGCVASCPRTSRAPRPGHHKRSWVRRQILCEDVYLLLYLLLICVHILLYLLWHTLHAVSFPLSEISIWAF